LLAYDFLKHGGEFLVARFAQLARYRRRPALSHYGYHLEKNGRAILANSFVCWKAIERFDGNPHPAGRLKSVRPKFRFAPHKKPPCLCTLCCERNHVLLSRLPLAKGP
jgi:hypothetical protein